MDEAVNLDDVGMMSELDPSGMLQVVEDFPQQCREALGLGAAVEGLPKAEGITRVAVLGMGGSGISGDVAQALLGPAMGLPVSVHKSYTIPPFLGPETLVFAVSYSGNTEETLAAEEQAAAQGCRLIAVTSGGVLLSRARAAGYPTVLLPAGFQPRAALGYLSLSIGKVAERMGLVQGFEPEAKTAIARLEERRAQWARAVPERSNLAKQLARRLSGKLPVIYGSDGLLSVAVYRWKCQLNEIAKVPAFCHVLPELDHNEIVGWKQLPELTRSTEVIFLVNREEHPRVARRVEITADLIRDNLSGVSVLHVGGANPWERFFGATYLGDFASCYLALLNREDPTPVERIAELKRRMAEPPESAAPGAEEDI